MGNFSDSDVRKFLAMCYETAARSPDPSNQNGAMIVDYSHGSVSGRNEPTRGFEVTPAMLGDRDLKLIHFEHAERNAIYAAARSGFITRDKAMFCPWAACADCARAISCASIADLYVHGERMDTTPERWRASVEQGLAIIRAGGTQIHVIRGPIDGPDIIVNGARWSPRGN